MDTNSGRHNLAWEEVVVNEARQWKGTPYVARACVKGVGADCGTFLHHCYSLVFPLGAMPKDYAVDWALHSDKEIYTDWIKTYAVEVDSPMFGGLGTFMFGRAHAHGGFVTESGKIIHAYGRTGVGKVKEDSVKFFSYSGGKPRPVKWWYPKKELICSYYQQH